MKSRKVAVRFRRNSITVREKVALDFGYSSEKLRPRQETRQAASRANATAEALQNPLDEPSYRWRTTDVELSG